jgi:hypothetical protein
VPLVPVAAAVPGVVTATRDARSDLGGWAVPVGALLTGGPGVPDGLSECRSLIRAVNRDAALRRRWEWNAVLPADVGGAPFGGAAMDAIAANWAFRSRVGRRSAVAASFATQCRARHPLSARGPARAGRASLKAEPGANVGPFGVAQPRRLQARSGGRRWRECV